MRKWFNYLSLVAIVFVVFPVFAEEGDFTGGEGSDTSELMVDSSDTASVEELGPFGGDAWDVAVDPVHNMVYATAKDSPNGLYRSSDGGTAWLGLANVDYGGGIAVEVDSGTGDVYAVFSGGVYKSTDQGVTYTNVTTAASNGFLVAGGQVVVGSFDGAGKVLFSDDGGANFTEHTFSSNSDEYIWDIDYSADTGAYYILGVEQSDQTNHLYRSGDDGVTWSEITLPSAVQNTSESRFAVSPLDDQVMAFTGGYAVHAYISITGGASWLDTGYSSSGVTIDQTGRLWMSEVYRDLVGSFTSYDDDNTSSSIGGHNVTVDPTDENIVYADGMPGLTKSTDRGATWRDINQGIKGVTISDISQANDKNVVWAAAYNGIAKTENFTAANPTWQFPVLEEPGFSVWTDPSNPLVAVVGVSSGTKRTTDGGVTWSDYAGTNIVQSHQVVDEIIADVNDDTILYAAVSNNNPSSAKDGAVMRSTDQGVSWENLNLTNNGSAQTITQSMGGDLYVGMGADSDLSGETGIYKYSGSAWEKLTGAPDQDIVKLIADPDDADTIYAVAGLLYNNGSEDSFGFYKTTDAGATWTHVTNGLNRIRNYTSLALQSSTTPNTLYLGAENYFGQGVLYKSADGGETWGLQYTGLQDETFYTLLFDGVTIGSSRGLFDVKSKAAITVKLAQAKVNANAHVGVTVTLKDAITAKKLKRQTVRLYLKKGSKFTLIDKMKTDRKGKADLTVHFAKAKQYKLVAKWSPNRAVSEEYASAISAVKKLNVR